MILYKKVFVASDYLLNVISDRQILHAQSYLPGVWDHSRIHLEPPFVETLNYTDVRYQFIQLHLHCDCWGNGAWACLDDPPFTDHLLSKALLSLSLSLSPTPSLSLHAVPTLSVCTPVTACVHAMLDSYIATSGVTEQSLRYCVSIVYLAFTLL